MAATSAPRPANKAANISIPSQRFFNDLALVLRTPDARFFCDCTRIPGEPGPVNHVHGQITLRHAADRENIELTCSNG